MTRDQAEVPVAAIVIGRNEGQRLVACLRSLAGTVSPMIYVDSGSTDGSVDAAQALGAEVVALDMTRPFTAARARNAGLERLVAMAPDTPFVQFVDGDCEVFPNWISTARASLSENPGRVAVAGRLRERHPEASVYNRLADKEWARSPGPAEAIGGIAMMRLAPVLEAGGFNPDLIAGEEPELCLRLRRAGWVIWVLGDDMAYHDLAMTRFSQWWRRMRRGGHAYAEGAALHGSGPERYNRHKTRRALLWGFGVPLAALAGSLITPWALLIFLAWPAQVLRLYLRGEGWTGAMFLTLGKIPEAQGVLGYNLDRMRGQRRGLIEHK